MLPLKDIVPPLLSRLGIPPKKQRIPRRLLPGFTANTAFVMGLLLIAFLFQHCAYIQARVAAKEHAQMVEELQAELRFMEKEDQRVRTSNRKRSGYTSVADSLHWQMRAVDKINQRKLDSIIAIHGYPGKSLVGNDLSIVGLLIVHHSQVDYMFKYRDVLIEATAQGELDTTLTMGFLDRLHSLQYGMAIFSKYTGFPMDTTVNADSLRQALGVPIR